MQATVELTVKRVCLVSLSQISKLEVDSPERFNLDISQLTDYPPRIYLDLVPPDQASPPAVLNVEGAELNVEGQRRQCSFTIPNECSPVQSTFVNVAFPSLNWMVSVLEFGFSVIFFMHGLSIPWLRQIAVLSQKFFLDCRKYNLKWVQI
jgi:hypothetical protein